MNFKTKLFWVMWLVGMVGVLSLLTLQIELPPNVEPPLPLPVLKFLTLLQPTILLTISVWLGLKLAPAVGLSAPALEAIANSKSFMPAIKPQLLPGAIGGLVGGLALVLIYGLWQSRLPAALQDAPSLPVLVRFLYGGITEEILLRWGWMTFLVWVAWRLLQRRQGAPNRSSVTISIVVSALLFGLGHLPIVAALNVGFTASLVLYIILANSVFGLIAGYLYWKYGLEAAMIAHVLCHVVLLVAAQAIA